MVKKLKFLGAFLLAVVISGVALVLVLWRTPEVNIVYMANSNYLPYMMVSMESAVMHKNKNSRYHIHVIAENFTAKDEEIVQKIAGDKITVTLYPAKKLNLDMRHLGRFSSFGIALQKLFIADYLSNVDKVLYLDADTLVQGDLTGIYTIGLRDSYAAAVKDGLMYQFPEHVAGLNLANPEFYFNSGVMLLNLDKIRKDDIMRRAVIYFNTHNEIFGDQDVLNAVFAGKVRPLSYRYNCNSTFFEEKDAAFLSTFYQEPVPQTPREVYDNAVILHFAGHKPWTPWFKHSYLQPLWQGYAGKAAAKYQISY